MENTQTSVAPRTIFLTVGQRGTYAGFPATIIRHYEGNMYEIRVPGGPICTDAGGFIPTVKS